MNAQAIGQPLNEPPGLGAKVKLGSPLQERVLIRCCASQSRHGEMTPADWLPRCPCGPAPGNGSPPDPRPKSQDSPVKPPKRPSLAAATGALKRGASQKKVAFSHCNDSCHLLDSSLTSAPRDRGFSSLPLFSFWVVGCHDPNTTPTIPRWLQLLLHLTSTLLPRAGFRLCLLTLADSTIST